MTGSKNYPSILSQEIINGIFTDTIYEVGRESIFTHKLPTYINVHTKIKNKLSKIFDMNTAMRRINNDMAHMVIEDYYSR